MRLWEIISARVLWLVLVGFVVAGDAPAQDTIEDLVDEQEEEEEELQKIPGTDLQGLGRTTTKRRMRLPRAEELEELRISQDREIDPDEYIMGPGDILQLYIWGELDQAYPFKVNPEGYALIPTVGTFYVSNKTLAEVREQVIDAAQKERYPGVEVSLTLESMRLFNVYLTGGVPDQGSFTIHPVTRLSDLIERAGGFLDDLRGTSIEETLGGKKITRARQYQPQPSARRSIRITRFDGSVELVDLDMFTATGDLAHNPYLRMGDAIHVDFRTEEVNIFGSVNREGDFELRPGDTLGTLLTLAGGVDTNAPIEKVILWRFRDGGVKADQVNLLKNEPGQPPSSLASIENFPLQPRDMIFVRTRSDWQLTPTVVIYGEIQHIGRYRIEPGVTRLREVVERAGGFREEVSLRLSRVIRAKERARKDPELARLNALRAVSGLADMSPEDQAYMKTKGREDRGRLVVDFERLFNENDEEQNIPLLGGDVVFIATQIRTVNVSGQVKKPGLINFEAGNRVGYYLDLAGGYNWNADKGGARLIRARTSTREKLDKDAIVEPGDEIWVPENRYRDWVEISTTALRTVTETLALILLVRSI